MSEREIPNKLCTDAIYFAFAKLLHFAGPLTCLNPRKRQASLREEKITGSVWSDSLSPWEISGMGHPPSPLNQAHGPGKQGDGNKRIFLISNKAPQAPRGPAIQPLN